MWFKAIILTILVGGCLLFDCRFQSPPSLFNDQSINDQFHAKVFTDKIGVQTSLPSFARSILVCSPCYPKVIFACKLVRESALANASSNVTRPSIYKLYKAISNVCMPSAPLVAIASFISSILPFRIRSAI